MKEFRDNLVIPDKKLGLVGKEFFAFSFRKGGHFMWIAPVPSNTILIELYGPTINNQV